MMQPFINPNIYNYSQPIATQSLVGRYVNDFNEITANDVPMSGVSVFLKNDRTGIQTRQWSADGRIVVTNYEPKIEPIPSEPNNPSLNAFESRFEQITTSVHDVESRLNELAEQVSKLKPTSRKKEVADE